MRFDIMYERDRQTDTHTPSHTRTPHDGKGREKNHTGMTAAFHIVEDWLYTLGKRGTFSPSDIPVGHIPHGQFPPPGQLPSPPRS